MDKTILPIEFFIPTLYTSCCKVLSIFLIRNNKENFSNENNEEQTSLYNFTRILKNNVSSDILSGIINFKVFVDHILYCIYDNNGKPYGGFVRDTIVLRQYNDIDVIFSKDQYTNVNYYIKKFITDLVEAKFIVNILNSKPYDDTNRIINQTTGLVIVDFDETELKSDKTPTSKLVLSSHVKIQVIKGENSIYLDLRPDSHLDIDMDVNILAYTDKNQLVLVQNKYKLDLQTILDNINQKKFNILCHYSNGNHNCLLRNSTGGEKFIKRIQKLENKGWTRLNPMCEVSSCIFSSEKIIC